MKRKIVYTDEPLGDIEVIPDFLPRPELLSDAQLRAYELKRDLAAELLESVQEMKAGKTSGRRGSN